MHGSIGLVLVFGRGCCWVEGRERMMLVWRQHGSAPVFGLQKMMAPWQRPFKTDVRDGKGRLIGMMMEQEQGQQPPLVYVSIGASTYTTSGDFQAPTDSKGRQSPAHGSHPLLIVETDMQLKPLFRLWIHVEDMMAPHASRQGQELHGSITP